MFAPGDMASARARAQRSRSAGVNALHRGHREAWAQRWSDAHIDIRGDDELLRNVRYSLFQLMGAVGTEGEAALGARGLSGDGYNGHVFWDSDVFVLPFLAATCPPAARAMLEYRVRRIGAAMEQARELGLQGAKFPWESASSGTRDHPRHRWSDRAAKSCASAPGRWRITSLPMSRGPPAGTWTGREMTPFAVVR